jgi:hypothetical protein
VTRTSTPSATATPSSTATPTQTATPTASPTPTITPSPTCTGGDPDADGLADSCDNCPGALNPEQENSDDCDGFPGVDGGNACDICDLVCNPDQIDLHGIRAFPIAFVTPGGSDCIDSNNGFTGENDDLELDDDQLSQLIDLDDEDGDGTVEAGEEGNFDFTFFGKAIDRMVISANGYVYLLGEGEGDELSDLPADPAPDAGVLPRYDGRDFIVAAAWTDLQGSDVTQAGDDPCISFSIIGDNSSSTQVAEITFERVPLAGDSDEDAPITTQIRLLEATDQIEIHTVSLPATEAGETPQNVTRGVEGLFESVYFGQPMVGAAFLPGDNNAVTPRSNYSVGYTTGLAPEANPSVESGEECDEATYLPRCGDSVCYPEGRETTTTVCDFPDCSCGDGFCNPGEICETDCDSLCPLDCYCGNGVCEPDESVFTCVEDCESFCGDGICHPAAGESAGTCEDCFCGDGFCYSPEETFVNCSQDCESFCLDGICDPSAGESNASCSSDCFCGDGFCYPGQESFVTCQDDCVSSCGDNICDVAGGESGANCSGDCFCGDGVCDDSENFPGGCFQDCGF